MTHARTLPRYVGIAGLVAGLLAPVSSLAAVNTNGIEILSTTATGVKNGQYIEAAASVAYQHVNTAERIYTRQLVPVATSTVRRGAVAALSRGIMHPGLAIAITAAGLLLEGDEIQVMESGDQPQSSDFPEMYAEENREYTASGDSCVWEGSGGEFYNNPLAAAASFSPVDDIYPLYPLGSGHYGDCLLWRAQDGSNKFSVFPPAIPGPVSSFNDVYTASPVPATEEDLALLDPHIPPQLYDELVGSEDDIPEWEDAISLLPGAGSSVVPTNEQNVVPEVASKAGQWAENIAAQLDGEPAPNPDTDTDGKTASDQMYEDWQQPIPPFGEVEPEWQVETIDSLPDYDIGLGSGSCPAPTAITLPAPFNSVIELDWQPVCDFASMIRGAVIAVCMILSLYIVLRSA
ncbi:hypothetical protein LG302_14220 [Halomonas organivorans]